MNKLEKILLRDDIVKEINENIDDLITLIPEIKYMINFPHNHPHHHLDVWNHTLLALSKSPKIFDIRLALLLHDIGKPFSYQDEEIRHFKNHPIKSKIMSYEILNRLGYDKDYIDYITRLVGEHDTPISSNKIKKDSKFCNDLFIIQYCDALAHHPDKLERRIKYLEKVFYMFEDYQDIIIPDDIKKKVK